MLLNPTLQTLGQGGLVSTNTELVHDTASDARTHVDIWTTLPDDARRLHAIAACKDHDSEALWQIAEAYLTQHGRVGATRSAYTLRNYRHGVAALLLAWENEDLMRPARGAARGWLTHMEEQGLKPGTVTVRLAAARTLYKALRWMGAAEVDPFLDLRPSPARPDKAEDQAESESQRRPYSLAEMETLLAAAGLGDRALILLAGHAGLRAGEIMDLRWTDLDLESQALSVRKERGHKQRPVVLSTSTVDALRSIAPDALTENASDYVLPYRTSHEARARMRRLCARAGVPYRGLHALRQTCGTRLVQASHGNLELAARHLGHADIQAARIYGAWADEGLLDTIGGW